MGNGNDDYKNPVSPTAAAPVPPEVFPDQLRAQQSRVQGGERTETVADAPAGDEFDELKGEDLEQAVKDAEIEGYSNMTADEKRDALRQKAAG